MIKFANCVRFRVKPGKVDAFIKALDSMHVSDGVEFQRLVQTGERDFVTYGEWESEEKLAAARPAMIAFLDTIRGFLEEISPDLGVNDPVSGPVVLSR